jgi:hypothetical protein
MPTLRPVRATVVRAVVHLCAVLAVTATLVAVLPAPPARSAVTSHHAVCADQPARRTVDVAQRTARRLPARASRARLGRVGYVRRTSTQRWTSRGRKLTWKAVKGVRRYEVQVATDRRFHRLVQDEAVARTWTYASRLAHRRTYYVRVRAYASPTRIGPWSPVQTVEFHYGQRATDFRPGEPRLTRQPGRVQASWREQAYATRYTIQSKNSGARARTDSGELDVEEDHFPEGTSRAWMCGTPTRYTTLPYANPISLKMRSTNRTGTSRPSSDDYVYEVAGGLTPDPRGTTVSVGSWSLCRHCAPSGRDARVRAQLDAAGLDVVALQQSVPQLGSAWSSFGTTDAGNGTAVAWRRSAYTLLGSGVVGGLGPGTREDAVWVHLRSVATGAELVVASVELARVASADRVAALRKVLAALHPTTERPVVLAGDLGAYEIGEPAHRTLVQAGYWDTAAPSGSYQGRAYSTVNYGKSQSAKRSVTHFGARYDHIMTAGVRYAGRAQSGSVQHANVPYLGGPVVSDHNLQWSRVRLPR